MPDTIDVQTLADEFDFTPEEVTKIVAMFFKSAKKGLDALSNAIALSDYEALYKAAHSIKGSAGTLHLTELYTYALEVEKAGRNNTPYDYDAAYGKLADMIKAIEIDYRGKEGD
ncbi:MAG: Hpt domain-containing protein [Sulfuricurvum sp.]|jgi:HPt (histidine-containing phosphotransfer) domain-containing protein|uniref:Hpt domain-containing protein n=1 Tax=Sulfuricurvum sp. TaxID=2025608 RepID=UPI0025EF1431|nr:Hpt domain-containing protein [Sulfuricurvum sp.]MCK9372177.1 Hpt domain-containing protein [Sulfuricurvum sp.]